MSHLESLRRAYERETDPRSAKYTWDHGWNLPQVGLKRPQAEELLEEGLIEQVRPNDDLFFRLTEKGRGAVAGRALEHEEARIPASRIIEEMAAIVGYDDLKDQVAHAVDSRRRVHCLFEGPPAGAKSLFLEAVQAAAADQAYLAFGSRTSAAGLSDVLFDNRPAILLLDELDKVDRHTWAVLLGLMENGQVLETKSKRTRGAQLNTQVLAACNSSAKMPPELLSRFALHAVFPPYTRDQFLEVARLYLARVEGCPAELAALIGAHVYDNALGDIRRARGVWQLMKAATEAEVKRVVRLMMKYDPPPNAKRRPHVPAPRFGGM